MSSRVAMTVTQFFQRMNSYSYAYGPGGVTGLRKNPYTLASAVLASFGGLLFGYDQGVIANVLVMRDFRQRWAMTDWQEGFMTAMLEMGALIGALLAGVLADRYSRRLSILSACVVCGIGSTFQCAAQSVQHLIIGRTIGGLGIGSLSMLAPLYMAEISPPEVRGSLMALEQFAIVLGVVFGFWMGFVTRELTGAISWRLPLAIQLIPALYLAIGCIFLLPSPRLLIIQGKDEEALKTLAKLRLRTLGEGLNLLKLEFLEMKVEAEFIKRATASAVGKSPINTEIHGWMRLFSPKYVDRTMVGVIVMFFQQWSGINALIYYGPLLMARIGLDGDTAELIGSGGVGIVQFLAVVPAIMYIDRLGRKLLLQWGGLVMGAAHLCIALLVYHYHSSWASHHFAAWAAVGCVYLFTAAYGFSIGPIAWILPSEVLPLSIRSRGTAVATASNWVNNFIIGLVTPPLLSFSPTATFAVFSIACFGAALWSRMYVPETAGVSLEEIDQLFKSEAGREDAELRQEIAREVGLEALIQELSADNNGDN
ncbi:general substrate transporter [Fomitiporia mediterranea MF3/22]|uniref:general substrate transporter n=1 Tax=Fomitiporia mediterranea (strain MF3/22) TaxID=694068 RepID=UPI0004408150|nr:general substrate transporter [Fomitiporia mediterranea MF3/22]EJD08214.1 general substrate transporter [Fomitiporia mediterranea MF3/22]